MALLTGVYPLTAATEEMWQLDSPATPANTRMCALKTGGIYKILIREDETSVKSSISKAKEVKVFHKTHYLYT